MATNRTFSVTVHPYKSPTRASCAYEQGDTSSLNALVFIGGLTDGPHTVSYIRTLAKALEERRDLSYSVFEIRMRSSFQGFGTSSLLNDVEDISSLVKYLRSIGRKKIILMGHSTGTQVRLPRRLKVSIDIIRIVWNTPIMPSITMSPWMVSSCKHRCRIAKVLTILSHLGEKASNTHRI